MHFILTFRVHINLPPRSPDSVGIHLRILDAISYHKDNIFLTNI